jgi:ubiquinone/menaquinone biosynthesis C-methylase UbiE
MDRFEWTFDSVIDSSSIPELCLRTYLEIRDVREYLEFVARETKLNRTADVGCGFGRLVPLLAEFSREVVGFEREKELLEAARILLPEYSFVWVEDLSNLKCDGPPFDFVLVFTVLQHLTNDKAEAVLREIERITGPRSFILMCEQTDESDVLGDIHDENALLQHGRSASTYKQWLPSFRLIKTSRRINESTYRRSNIGMYMLFQRKE